MLYRIRNGLVAIPASTYLLPATVCTRGLETKYRQIQCNTNAHSQTFIPSAIRLWNTLPVDICQLLPDSFKAQLTTIQLMWIPVSLVSDPLYRNPEQASHMGCEVQPAWKCPGPLMPTIFRRAILTRKVGQSGLVLACDQGSLVARSVHTRLSLCVQRLWLVPTWLISRHIHTHRQHFYPHI